MSSKVEPVAPAAAPAPRAPAPAAPVEPPPPPPAGEDLTSSALGLRFYLHALRLHVSDGSARVKLEPSDQRGIVRIDRVASSADRSSVTVTVRFYCAEDDAAPLAFSVASIRARLENQRALALHDKGEHLAAAAGFARASALDPSLELAVSNHACALNRAGRRRQAVQALAPLIARNPLRAYYRALVDPELVGLLEEPELRALRAAAKGDARAADRLEDDRAQLAALDPSRKHVAVVETFVSDFAQNAWRDDLVFLELATGQERLRIPLGEAHDEDYDAEHVPEPALRARNAQHVAIANRLLRDLGFAVDPGAAWATGDNGRWRTRFVGTSLVFAHDDHGTRIHRDGKRLPTSPPIVDTGARAGRAVYLPSVHAVVAQLEYDQPEDCIARPSEELVIFRMPQ